MGIAIDVCLELEKRHFCNVLGFGMVLYLAYCIIVVSKISNIVSVITLAI